MNKLFKTLCLFITLLAMAFAAPAYAQVMYTGKADPHALSNVPSNSIGTENSWYLDLLTGNAYGPKQSGQWPPVPTANMLTIPGGLGTGVAASLATAIGASGGLQTLAAPTINVGNVCNYDATITSGTYSSSTGAVSLTLSSTAPGLGAGQSIVIGNLTGTGSYANLNGNYTSTTGSGGTTLNYTATAALGSITITGGVALLPTGVLCIGGSSTPGFITGNIAIGNNVPGIDAFVNIHIDNLFTNPNQEMRGVTVALREVRTINDETLLGEDEIGFSSSNVIDAGNTKNIQGNLKAYFGETILAPGSYTVTHAYPYQASLTSIGSGVTLSYWAGYVVSQIPTACNTQCTAVYGMDIFPQAGLSSAAINIRGEGVGNAIKFPATAIYEDTSAKLNLNLGNNFLVLQNALTSTTASTGLYTPPTTILGYLSIIIGGNPYKIPYYAP